MSTPPVFMGLSLPEMTRYEKKLTYFNRLKPFETLSGEKRPRKGQGWLSL
jgi:hypothetical protein